MHSGDDIVLEAKDCYCHTCIHEEITYGQVVLYDDEVLAIKDRYTDNESNARVCKTLDNQLYKRRMMELLLK